MTLLGSWPVCGQSAGSEKHSFEGSCKSKIQTASSLEIWILPFPFAALSLRSLCSSTFRAISSFLCLRAIQNLEPARILSPFQMNKNGTTHIRRLMPPRKLHAPAIPSLWNIGVEARGRTVANKERVHEAAALAEAAKISYASRGRSAAWSWQEDLTMENFDAINKPENAPVK
jgi:hypothetical protein